MHVKMVRRKTPFALMFNEAGANYKVKIERATLHVRKVKVAHAVALAHVKALKYGNAKYPLQRVECKTFSVPAGGRDVTLEKIFTGQLPTLVVVDCVDNNAFNEVLKKNPFNFQNYKITRISLHVDGEEKCPLTCDFETGRIAQAYMSLFSSTEKAFKDEDIDISREDYVNSYSLFCFDMTPDLRESDHFSLIKSGNVRLAINFAGELARTINVIVYVEFQNVLEVDKNRDVSTTSLFNMLNTEEITNLLLRDKRTKTSSRGVFASDELPLIAPTSSLYICNTDSSSQPGKHWVAIYIDNKKKADFFDSFGMCHGMINYCMYRNFNY